jgi:AraC-like DNA-binding protein
MTDLLFEYDHILIRSEYKTPELHSHLASHLIIGLNGNITCDICGDSFETNGVCIASDIPHTVHAENGELLLYLYDTASYYSEEITEKYLIHKPYSILDDNLVSRIQDAWANSDGDLQIADSKIMAVCDLNRNAASQKDKRITETLEYLKQLDTIPDDIMEQLCSNVCLSQSRFSHLFKEQVGISLHRYLALDKMKKGYLSFIKTGSITDAAMYAGFDSPSHFAATCKRMFGISFSEFAGSMKIASN